MIEPNKLHAYVDGELNDAERREVESRLSECAKSRAEVESIRGMKSMLGQISNEDCQAVWANCQSRLDAIDRVKRSGNFITRYSWAFVTGVALILLIGGGYARRAQAGTVDNSALAGIFSNSSRQTPEKQIQNAQLDQVLRIANRNLNKLRFVRGTRVIQNDQVAERLDYEDVKGPFSLLVLPERSSFDDMTPDESGKYFFGQIDQSTKVVGWRAHNACLVLVGQREFSELRELAQKDFVLPE